MKKEIIQKLQTSFEDVAQVQNGVEFWFARDLQVLLGNEEWRNFTKVIEKAQEACENAGLAAEDQFVDQQIDHPWQRWEGTQKKPHNLHCEAVPSLGYVTVVAQRIRG